VSRLDLNADVGESFGRWRLGDDEALLGVVTSANVACGFHAGDPLTLRRTCAAATARQVRIGAQVGYRDLAGFGRRFIDVAPDDLAADVLYQLGALDAFARVAGGRVRYVKPHGALYNAVVRHEAQAAAIADAVRAYDPDLSILGLPGSALLSAAEAHGLRTVAECFADRAYRSDGSLVPRIEAGAVIADVDTVVARAVRMAVAHEVVAEDGAIVAVAAESICVHGDTPRAAEIAVAIRTALDEAGVTVVAFAD
jgi:UPF0271 protein